VSGGVFQIIVLLLLLSCSACDRDSSRVQPTGKIEPVSVASENDKIVEAYRSGTSGIFVESEGTVEKILPDGREGSPHQRFIVRLLNGHTLLIAHNIALAPRLDDIEVGDTVNFHGQYEWNAKGGVIHWTHHDPNNRQEGGWLLHAERRYE